METIEKISSPITILSGERKWLLEHASFINGFRLCDITGAKIIMKEAQHSVWENGVVPAGRDTATVFHLYCPGCQNEPEFTPGSPIERDELMSLNNNS